MSTGTGMPQTAAELFELIPLAVQAYPDRFRDLGGAFIFDIGEEGKFIIDAMSTPPALIRDPNKISEGAKTCTIEISHEAFKKVMGDHRVGLELFFKNEIRISGDTDIALNLGSLFEVMLPYAP